MQSSIAHQPALITPGDPAGIGPEIAVRAVVVHERLLQVRALRVPQRAQPVLAILAALQHGHLAGEPRHAAREDDRRGDEDVWS